MKIHHESDCILCQQNHRGFTLLEVLIALAIFSFSAAALLFSGGQSIKQVSYVREKVLASWLAENELNKIYIEGTWPPLGKNENVKVLAHRQWVVEQEVTSRDVRFRKITINVYTGDKASENNKVYRLIGFMRDVNS